jgi:hypothetical protein
VGISEYDRGLLEFAAEHRIVVADQARALLGISPLAAERRLRALARAGLLRRQELLPCYQITRQGLGLIGSNLPAPRRDPRGYEHDVGLGWLWLAARSGTFGELREVISERRIRSADGRADPAEEPLAVRLGGYGPGGRPSVHYPDLVLVTRTGHRIAVELELSLKGRGRRERILGGYAADARFDAVLYLVEDPVVARAVQASARRLGTSHTVLVQPVRLSASMPEGTVAERVQSRRAEPVTGRGTAAR